MAIIQDTREGNKLFPVNKVINRKLSEGDYSSEYLESHITFERKSPEDLFGTLTYGHARFKKEILRAEQKRLHMIIIVECSENMFFSFDWMPQVLRRKNKRTTPQSLKKMIDTMNKKYPLIHFVWCRGRDNMRKIILNSIFDLESSLPILLEIDNFDSVDYINRYISHKFINEKN